MTLKKRCGQGDAPLCRFVASFIEHLSVERGLSPNTCEAYRADCERFASELPPELRRDPKKIRERHVFEFLVRERQRGRNVTSVRRSLSALRTFFRFLVRERVMETNPARLIENPKTWARVPEVLQVSEVERLLQAAREHPSRYPLRDAALLELAYATGLRVGELVSLELESIRHDLGVLRCIGKGSRERIVPVSRTALEAVARWVQGERPRLVKNRPTRLLFVSRGGRPLGREVVAAILRKYARLAGLAVKVTPHTLRHSFATHILQRGADLRIVQEILGHRKVATTEIYTHLNRSDLKTAHRKYHPRG